MLCLFMHAHDYDDETVADGIDGLLLKNDLVISPSDFETEPQRAEEFATDSSIKKAPNVYSTKCKAGNLFKSVSAESKIIVASEGAHRERRLG